MNALVAELFRLREVVGIPRYLLARRAGVSNVSLWQWETGRSSPSLFLFEVALNAIGYRLRIVPATEPYVYVPNTSVPKGRRAYYEKRKTK